MKRPLLAAMSLALLGACTPGAPNLSAAGSSGAGGGAASTSVPWPTPDASADITTASGLKYSILTPGRVDGLVATVGKTVSVNYAGWLTSGKAFDDSFSRGKPFEFHLGAGEVIKGWDEGVTGMQVGERRKLVVPGNLAYGPGGTNGIPPNATLIFEVELLAVKP
jgi:FKBP-type peptidyl-prolyl cis-trans isomerase